MSKKIKYTKGEIKAVTMVEDFLPKDLILKKEDVVKVTILKNLTLDALRGRQQ